MALAHHPPEQAVEIRLAATATGSRRGFGSMRVEAAINGVAWRTSIFPQKSGAYILPIKAAVRAQTGIAAGDEVSVTLRLLQPLHLRADRIDHRRAVRRAGTDCVGGGG